MERAPSRRRRLCAAAIVLVLLLGLVRTHTVQAAGAWNIVPAPSHTDAQGHVLAMAAASATDIWAVGYVNSDMNHAMMEHYDGTAWTPASFVQPSAAAPSEFDAVTVISGTDAWAVGYSTVGGVQQNLTEHWNGTAWSVVAIPNFGSGLSQQLTGVSATSTSDVWASGYYTTGTNQQTLVEHWTGATWSIMTTANNTSPTITPNYLLAITAVTSTNVWAVGYWFNSAAVEDDTLVEHYNGTTWTTMASPSPSTSGQRLSAIRAATATDIWATGYQNDSSATPKGLGEHYTGAAWAVVTMPDCDTINPSEYDALTGIGTNDVYAIGSCGGPAASQVAHWNGTAWTAVTGLANPYGNINWTTTGIEFTSSNIWLGGFGVQNTGQGHDQILLEHKTAAWAAVTATQVQGRVANELLAMTAVSASDVWADGYWTTTAGSTQPLIEHYDGAIWSIVSAPTPSTTVQVTLTGISAVTTSDVWAAGDYVDATGTSQVLIEHWNGSAWSIVTTPSAPASTNYFINAVTAVSSTEAWAVGQSSPWSTGVTATLTLHEVSGTWSVVASPSPGSNGKLMGATNAGAGKVTVGGSYVNAGGSTVSLVLAWNGAAWSQQASTGPTTGYCEIYAITAISATDAWAVGYQGTGTNKNTFAQHWNGTAWSIATTVDPAYGSYLQAVSGSSSSDVWAVGFSSPSNQVPLTEHWNGTSWSNVANAALSAGTLYATAALSANNAWAVGDDYTTSLTQVLAEQYTTTASPTVTSVSPSSGPTAGGTTVTISGSGFNTTTAVKFGAVAAASYTVNSDTQITATSPAGAAGTVDISITNAAGANTAGASDRFTYGAAAPAVTSISPATGSTAGGTSVTVTGTGFTGATAVKFGAVAATSFTVVSATSITATSPAGSAGIVDLRVTTPGGTSPTSAADQFTYAAPGAISVGAMTATTTLTATLGPGTITSSAQSLNNADWADTTGSGSGWNGTLALQQLVFSGAWNAGGSTALASTGAGVYTATSGTARYVVSVTSDGGGTVSFTFSGAESGTVTAAAKGSAVAVGSRGITITFASASTYKATDVYSVRAASLPAAGTVTMGGAGSCVPQGATTGGANLPAFVNVNVGVSTGANPATYGGGVKFLSAGVGAGAGTFTCSPLVTITIDSNNALAATYSAGLRYSITSGP